MNSEFNFKSLMDREIGNEEVQALLSSFPCKTTKELKEYTYVSILESGISLCFNSGKLKSIYFYNEGISGFKQFKGDLSAITAINSLSLSLKNQEVVEYLGDTNKKGGGSSPIWLAYERLGLEITFVGKQWTDTENPIAFICLFTPESAEADICCVCTKQITNGSDALTCDKSCSLVKYCSKQCKNAHINYHYKHCLSY